MKKRKAKQSWGKKKNFYAVFSGRTTGIFTSWHECKESIHGYYGAKFKGFETENEARRYMQCL